MADNFSFLKSKFPILAKFGSLAEQYLYSDSNSCLIKLRMLGETVVNLIFGYEKISVDPELNAAKRINLLHDDGVLEDDFADILHILRKKGNQAAHENYDSEHDAEICLRMAYRLSEWFMQVYGDWQYQNKPFILPTAQPQSAPLQAAAETPTQEEKLLTEQAAKQAEEAPVIAKEERRKQSHEAAAKSKKSEEETRYIIDQKLRMAGWEVDSKEITYGDTPATLTATIFGMTQNEIQQVQSVVNGTVAFDIDPETEDPTQAGVYKLKIGDVAAALTEITHCAAVVANSVPRFSVISKVEVSLLFQRLNDYARRLH